MRKKHPARKTKPHKQHAAASGYDSIKDLIGAADDGLSSDLGARKKHYLKKIGYGRTRPRWTGHAQEARNKKV